MLRAGAIEIAEDELEESFIRSPGAGGQKVNKTATSVQLRFNARKCKALSHAVFLRLKKLAGRRMTSDGYIVITANTYRTQKQNRDDARERLSKLIRDALVVPKCRRPTKPSRAAKAKRVDAKKQKGQVKKLRGRVRANHD